MMAYLKTGLSALILIAVAVVILNTEVGTETVVQTYYTHELLKYEKTFTRERMTTKWQWGWPLRVTVPQVQYGVKNVDSIGGEFLMSISFDNSTDRRSVNRRLALAPGQEETVAVNSPIRGPQSFSVSITPPSKRVEHLREVEVPYKVYEKLWQLRNLRTLSFGR